MQQVAQVWITQYDVRSQREMERRIRQIEQGLGVGVVKHWRDDDVTEDGDPDGQGVAIVAVFADRVADVIGRINRTWPQAMSCRVLPAVSEVG